MRIASYALWLAAPLSLASFALLGAACSSSENTTSVAGEAGADATKTGDGGAKETSVDEQPDTGAACKLDQPLTAKAACDTCAEKSCCGEANACSDDKDCGAFVVCAAACLNDAGVPLDGGASSVDAGSTQGCLAACQNAHRIGAQLYQALGRCIQGSCKSDCL